MSGNRELVRSYGPDEFAIDWYSGSGAGGQHRNKHQNCCRITHVPTGLRAQGTESRSRVANQRAAFRRLAALLVARDFGAESERGYGRDVVRTYHFVNDRAIDHGSGLRCRPDDVADNLDRFRKANDRRTLPRTGR